MGLFDISDLLEQMGINSEFIEPVLDLDKDPHFHVCSQENCKKLYSCNCAVMRARWSFRTCQACVIILQFKHKAEEKAKDQENIKFLKAFFSKNLEKIYPE